MFIQCVSYKITGNAAGPKTKQKTKRDGNFKHNVLPMLKNETLQDVLQYLI